MLLAMVALDSITSLWMLLQYAYEVWTHVDSSWNRV